MTDHKHTNALIHETSPYLLQHAHNPVDWFPWGEEALSKAKTEDKPILLSIGYSACHWCHVMEHESFEDEEIAKLMNDNFINIKVDREERPDLDQIYMTAVQMMTGHGGWPMTMFLTPEGVPFYGGTYFPPDDRYNMPSFPRVLLSVAEAYRSQREQVGLTATQMLGELRRVGLATESRDLLTTEILDSSYRQIAKNYDRLNGGFGGAPKFPPAMTLEFFLHMYHRTHDEETLKIVTETCRKMAEGGMYDQLGGGFHRYSVDAKWLVPHFEKMLYDNALLARLYLHVYQLTKDHFARRIATEILDYVAREMTDPRGGFYSSQDADSEGVEGKFFVWSREEVLAALGESDGAIFADHFDITANGNFEGHNILHVNASIQDVAGKHQVDTSRVQQVIETGRRTLFGIRERRVKPGRDEKVLTAWNGLMLASFAEASAILSSDKFRQVARANARFILNQMSRDGRLLRSSKGDEAKLNAYLEDYASFVDGLISLYETTGEIEWIENAIELADKMIEEFWDEEEGGFFFTGKSHERLIIRSKEWMDNATPSGNSIAAMSLLRLSLLTGNEDYRRYATTILRMMADQVRRYPSAFGFALTALDFYLASPLEVALVASDCTALFGDLWPAFWGTYVPNRVVAPAADSDPRSWNSVRLLEGRVKPKGGAMAFVCEHYACQAPTQDPTALTRQLSRN